MIYELIRGKILHYNVFKQMLTYNANKCSLTPTIILLPLYYATEYYQIHCRKTNIFKRILRKLLNNFKTSIY